jgi:hypothetical protein
MGRSTVALLVTATALLLPAAAQGAEVRALGEMVGPSEFSETPTYLAARGESNRLTITLTSTADGRTVTFEDPGASIHAEFNCESLGEHAARCYEGSGPITGVLARLGDRADSARVASNVETYGQVRVFGGPGADEIVGSSGGDALYGNTGPDAIDAGEGGDSLVGGAGADELDGGPGADRLRGDGYGADPPSPDEIDGGPDEDVVSYFARREPVHVDLARAPGNGAAGEDDVLTGIEDVEGSTRGDVLAGDAGPNRLIAGSGAVSTKLEGRGGDDVLSGGPHDDTISGGDGDDLLYGAGGSDAFHAGAGADSVETYALYNDRDTSRSISCGPGPDVVTFANLHDLIPASCEAVQFANGFRISPVLERVDGSAIRLDVRRREPGAARPCRAVVGLYAPYARTASGQPPAIAFRVFDVRRDEVHPVIGLNDYGRALLRRRRHLRILVRVAYVWRCGATWPGNVPRDGFTARL